MNAIRSAIRLEDSLSVEKAPNQRAISPELRSIIARRGLYGLGEAYMQGDVQIDDIEAVVRAAIQEGLVRKWSARRGLCLVKELALNPQTGAGVFLVARRHYDLGNNLFETMLDNSMTYTCGYWENASDLNQAQNAKLDLICQKLQLQPGMRVLDIGCGWGNFAQYAARKYGVSVVGLTVSEKQAELAQKRCEGLSVEIRLQDYREYSGNVDRVVSIEMIEAVGRKNLPTFFAAAHNALNRGGLFLLQAISGDTFSRSSSGSLDDYVVWILKRIFPNGYLPKMDELMAPARRGLIPLQTQFFRDDYARTLQAWEENFEAGWSSLAQEYGERFRRMWKFYLGGCRALFREQEVLLYQVLYSKK